MTLQEQFEKENYERPVEPYSESENPEQWCRVLKWTEDYTEWLEAKFTSHNSDYAAALKVWDEFGEKSDGMLDSQFGYWVMQRLNQPNG